MFSLLSCLLSSISGSPWLIHTEATTHFSNTEKLDFHCTTVSHCISWSCTSKAAIAASQAWAHLDQVMTVVRFSLQKDNLWELQISVAPSGAHIPSLTSIIIGSLVGLSSGFAIRRTVPYARVIFSSLDFPGVWQKNLFLLLNCYILKQGQLLLKVVVGIFSLRGPHICKDVTSHSDPNRQLYENSR